MSSLLDRNPYARREFTIDEFKWDRIGKFLYILLYKMDHCLLPNFSITGETETVDFYMFKSLPNEGMYNHYGLLYFSYCGKYQLWAHNVAGYKPLVKAIEKRERRRAKSRQT